MCMKSDNNTMYIPNYFYDECEFIVFCLGANYRVLCTKYGMKLNNIMKVWNERCADEEEIIRKCEQVRELCDVRDGCHFNF